MSAPVPPLRQGEPPIAFLVDYDGTIAITDVGDAVMAAHVPGRWEEEAAQYDSGLTGSRRLMTLEMSLVRTDPANLYATAAVQPHDPQFAPFVRRALAAGIPVEVVSDGFGFYIPPALEMLGLSHVPVATNVTTFDGDRARISFPDGHPTCFVCGTCKRNRVLAHQAAGRAVVFIGDGESDRYAAGYADIVYAKHALIKICAANGWPFQRWTEFGEIHAWLDDLLARWQLDSAAIAPPRARPFFCGPEVWGEGLFDPPSSAGLTGVGPGMAGSRGDLDEGLAPG